MKNDKKNDEFERKINFQSQFGREREREHERNGKEDEWLFTYREIMASRYIDIREPTKSRELPKIFHQDSEPFIDISASQ